MYNVEEKRIWGVRKKRKEMTKFLAEATQDDLFIAIQQDLVSPVYRAAKGDIGIGKSLSVGIKRSLS